MEIRKITVEDVDKYEEKIINLFEQLTSANFPANLDLTEFVQKKPAEMRKYIEDGTAIIFGAFEENELIGFLWAYKKDYFGELRVHVAYNIVDKDFRSSGANTRFTFKIHSEARKLGADALEIMVTYENERLIEHYKQINFQIERVRMVKPLK